MTNYELNQAIHEWMGRGEWVSQEVEYCEKCGVEGITEIGSPDYTNDRNDVREFLAKIIADDPTKELTLGATIGDSIYEYGWMKGYNAADIIEAVMLTPRQLAEAGAKAVGIWKEQTND